MIAVLVAAAAAVVAGAFSADLGRRFAARRRPHEGVWAVSLGLFAAATAMVAIGLGAGWSGPVYGIFWLAGALVTVPLLAVGQLILLDREHTRVWLGAAVVVVMASLLAVTVSTMNPAALASADDAGAIPVGRDVWGDAPATTLLAPFNWSGLIVVAGCVWSAIRSRRPGVLLIAVGVLVAGASFSFVRSGIPNLFTITLGAGVTLMYAGFRSAGRRPVTARAGASRERGRG